MPKISEFFGISVYMYWFDDSRHKLPHFHALFEGKMAVFGLDGACLAGDIGPRASRLVKEWATERRTELNAAWEKAIKGKEVPWIKAIN
ncbi:MAG: DUF4160 domain-containing protein [Deltaproteobacteria bacterium]|nr:DUF4160 domain-containing protein [Deltaproteobacteria bacterium]